MNLKELKQLSILDVANQLGMSMVKTGQYSYSWQEHDSFVIHTRDNYFNWFSRSTGGDVINMVQVVQEELTGEKWTFKQAKHFLESGTAQPIKEAPTVVKEDFQYYLKPFESEFIEARDYLTKERGLSSETIDFFKGQGVIDQATKKTGEAYEPVIVFKSLDRHQKLVGASLQGINQNHQLYEKGRLKQIMRGSDGTTGLRVDIGTPKRLIFAESPIDLMSYYELNKDKLQDVRLVSMDGLKESTVSRHVAELLFEVGIIQKEIEPSKLSSYLTHLAEVTTFFEDGKHEDLITLAVDHDEPGMTFIDRLRNKGVDFTIDIPPKAEYQEKVDWNDYLKGQKEKTLDRSQEATKKERTNFSQGSLQLEAEGSPTPEVVQTTSFERSVTSRPTLSSHHLHFTVTNQSQSSRKRAQHSVTQHELNKINRRGRDIQEAAQFYRDELANSKISYFTADGNVAQVTFLEKNFMHLTGLKPLGEGQTPEKILHDFAVGGELAYNDILLWDNDSAIDKIKVLPDLRVVLEMNSFYFDSLQTIDRYKGRFDSLIKADDKDIMLLFRATDTDGMIPVSIFRARNTHLQELAGLDKNEILGIFRERDGLIEEIALNRERIADNGKAMIETLKKIQETEIIKEQSKLQNGGMNMVEYSEQIKQKQIEKEELERDSDGDGLSDHLEKTIGTNPFSPDTDGDGKSDHEEVSFGSNPIDVNHPTDHTQPAKSVSELIQSKDTKGLSAVLKAGVRDYFNSDTYKKYLEAMSKFHRYSPRNIQLILNQNPNASHVASFKKWKDEFKRGVKKGEKALWVLAPITVKRKDPKTREVLLDEQGNELTYSAYKFVPVFDVSQTAGKELAKAIYELDGTYEDYGKLFKAAKEVSETNGVSLSFGEDTGKAKGYYAPFQNKIVIKKGMSEQQTLKTIFHEMAHSDLHHSKAPNLKNSTRELQAESVAFVVANHYGLDTSDYSFAYLASWTNDPQGLRDLETQIKIVQKEANHLISRLDQTLEKIQKKELKKEPLQEKIERFKQETNEKIQEVKEKEMASERSKKSRMSDKEMSQ